MCPCVPETACQNEKFAEMAWCDLVTAATIFAPVLDCDFESPLILTSHTRLLFSPETTLFVPPQISKALRCQALTRILRCGLSWGDVGWAQR
eukprot:m.409938 g.409938  ORF g.409938 m.409938 type:complete len:92 (+) comp16804_c0_seq14:230-505(+)